MRLCFICPEPIGKGGIGTYTKYIVEGLKRNVNITLFVKERNKYEYPLSSIEDVEIIKIDDNLLKWYINVSKHIIKRYKEFDFVECPEFGGSLYASCKLFRKIKEKLIVRLHMNTKIVKYFEEKSGVFEYLKTRIIDNMEKTLVKSVKLITAPSRAIAEIEGIMWGIPIEKIKVFPNPIKLPINEIDKENVIIKNFGTDNYVLYFGRLQKRKGIFDFVESIKYVRNKEVTFVIVGADPFNIKEKLKKSLPRYLRDRVIFIDYLARSKLMRVIKDARVVVLPSLFENFPYVVLETMALGTLLITTKVGGIREIITHLENGILIEPNNPQQIAWWIDFILSDENEDIVNKMKKNAIRKVEEFESKKIAKCYLKILEVISK